MMMMMMMMMLMQVGERMWCDVKRWDCKQRGEDVTLRNDGQVVAWL